MCFASREQPCPVSCPQQHCLLHVLAGLNQVRPELSPEDEENGAQPRPECRVMSTGNEQTPMPGLGRVLETEGNPDCSDGLKLILLLLRNRCSCVQLFEIHLAVDL